MPGMRPPPWQAPHGTHDAPLSLPALLSPSLPHSDHTAEQLQRELKASFPPCKTEASQLLQKENVHDSLQHFKNANKNHAPAREGAAQASSTVGLLGFSLVKC